MKQLFTSLFSLFVSLHVFAGLGEDFRALKDSGVDYQVIGAVCEEVARLRFQEEFPSNRYSVVTGVEYGDGTRTIGELDVVVFENGTQKVARVAEVKCWRDTNGAIKKAHNQRQRFQNTLASGKQVYFRSLHSKYQFKKDNFMNTREFLSVAQKGSKVSGFDIELSYQLDELMKLRQMMMDCQASRQCARPH